MDDMDRRSVVAVGLTVAAVTPLLSLTTPARAQEYGPDEGTEIAPGVRWVDLGEGHSDIPAYKSIKIGDAVYQPGAGTQEALMDNDMVCTILAVRDPRMRADPHRRLRTSKAIVAAFSASAFCEAASAGEAIPEEIARGRELYALHCAPLTKLRDEEPSISKVGRIWTCAKDVPEQNTNQSDAVAVMRTIDLLPA